MQFYEKRDFRRPLKKSERDAEFHLLEDPKVTELRFVLQISWMNFSIDLPS